jgi:hypothetical protein
MKTSPGDTPALWNVMKKYVIIVAILAIQNGAVAQEVVASANATDGRTSAAAQQPSRNVSLGTMRAPTKTDAAAHAALARRWRLTREQAEAIGRPWLEGVLGWGGWRAAKARCVCDLAARMRARAHCNALRSLLGNINKKLQRQNAHLRDVVHARGLSK